MARWTRDQLLLALGLYFETPFGQQHQNHPPIIELAQQIGRTQSAVAMKLSNFTSLDPAEAKRGVSGLSGASKADREIWAEFHNHRARLVDEIQSLRESVTPTGPLVDTVSTPTGPTTRRVEQTQRRYQQFFRRVVLGSYESRCCVTGLPIPALLRASHIVPWKESVEQRLNPSNGLCLAATFDAAFDRGLISFDSEFRLVLGKSLLKTCSNAEVEQVFLTRQGECIQLPEKNLPDSKLMQWHFQNVFVG